MGDAIVEDSCHDNEAAEEQDLDSETACDDMLPKIDATLLFACGEYATALLDVSLAN